MGSPTDLRTRAISEFVDRYAKRASEHSLTVFVCGPTVPTAQGGAKLDGGAELRRFVTDQMEKLGCAVVWGEHHTFRAGNQDPRVEQFNDADRELIFAHETADLVLIIPDSPGSFAELGSFGMHKNIPNKLLVIFDSRYRGSDGFLVQAVAKAAKTWNATICFRNYEKKSQIWKAVKKKLREMQMVKVASHTHV